MRADLAGATVRIFVDPLLAVVFPSRCPSCAGQLSRPTTGPLCEACWSMLDRAAPVARCRCGSPLSGVAHPTCGRCRRGLTPLAASLSLGAYDGPLRAVIHELKYHGRRRVAERIAERIAAAPVVSAVLTPDTVLVPVPLHPRRRRERGFNQAELIALALGRTLRLPVRAACLVRRKDTPSQTGLTAKERRDNVKDAFAVVRRAQVAGRAVVLVDDVVTTGATLRACARALLAAGAIEVRTVSAARVN